jgi:rhodanese-related sulfurtransferase
MIIGVIGFIGSGKGTAADILVEKHGFAKLSFADAVKDATAAIFGWQRSLLEGDTNESREFREAKDEWWSNKFGYDFSPRLALQMMGTEAGRDVFHPDVWIHALERKMEMYKNVVIADVRFPNEIEWMRSKGGFAVRVSRGPDPEWYDTALDDNKNGLDPAVSQMSIYHPSVHYSEWAWAGQIMDYQLDNNGSIPMLEADITHMLKVFTGPQKPAILAA